ncbi:hypothetical protein ACFQZI_14900 [Mucilaginibacter lutimaris]|uniref:Uncharacterized protein n=1 Tax=Mucilaginibacter lutimaris TaxID=931629 RepID=A0ABW2ZIT2_9SPHI
MYIVIVIALIIALLCGSLIAAAFYYRTYHAIRNRQERLNNNMMSGLNLLLAVHQPLYDEDKQVQLFDDDRDTVRLSKRFWGGYDVGVSKAYMERDSSVGAILIGNQPDSMKWYAIWLADEDRPLSVTGKSRITGQVYLPKAGVRSAYVNGHGYEGAPGFLSKKHFESKRELPGPDLLRVAEVDRAFEAGKGVRQLRSGTIVRSFGGKTDEYRYRTPLTIAGVSLSGNIIIRCDSLLTIDSTSHLDNVMVFAPAIVVRPGFRGRCQLFARDSIHIGDRATFSYPSMAALVRTSQEQVKIQGLIRFGRGCSFTGSILSWEKVPGITPPATDLGREGVFTGQIYTGQLGFGDKTVINGSVTCRRFFYVSGFTKFENYLVNVQIDANALSPFFSSSAVFPGALPRTKKVVLWLK